MIRRIILENYMSHARTVIEPADGLTVLVGPNNCGKSAVVSALQTVCGQHAGDFMVRHGQKVCRITVETSDGPAGVDAPAGAASAAGSQSVEGRQGDDTPAAGGHSVTWQRKGGAVSYVIDGRDVHRAGRGNLPDGLHEILKLPPVESKTRDEDYHVHFGCQKEPIFLLDSESDTAAFFSSSAEAERLLEMQRRHKQKVQAAKGEQRTTDADLKRLDEKLAALTPLEQLAPEVEHVEAEHRRLMEDARAAELLERRIGQIEQGQRRLTELTARAGVLADVRPPPALDAPAPLEHLIARSDRARGETARQRARVVAIAGLQPPPAQRDDAAIAIVCHRMAAVERQLAEEAARAAALAPLADPPAPADVRPLQQVGHKLRMAHAAVAAAQARSAALAALADPPVLSDPAPLDTALAKLSRVAGQVERSAAAVTTAERGVADVERRIVAFVVDNPVCPTCGGVLDADHLMHGGPTHVRA